MTERQLAPIVSQALSFTVTDAKTMTKASELLSGVKQYEKQLTEEKEKVTKPLTLALNAERARFKPLEDKIKTVIAHLRSTMSAYQQAELARTKVEEEKLVARVEKGTMRTDTAVRKLAEIDRPDKTVGNTTFRTDYEVVVTDLMAIPVEYLKIEVRTQLLKTALKEGKKIIGAELKEIQVPVVK